MLQRKYMQKNKSIARTVSIEAVLQPRFYYAMSYFSFDAEVLFAFFAFGDTFFTLGLMVHIGLGSDRRRLAGFSGRFSRSLTSRLLSSSSSSSFLFFSSTSMCGCFFLEMYGQLWFLLQWYGQLLNLTRSSHADKIL